MISIRDSSESIAYIPIEKTIKTYLDSVNDITQFIYKGEKDEDYISSHFDSEYCQSKNPFFINVFIDDFQLSNPLLSKKALKHEMTGIYFRFLTKSKFRHSNKSNIHLLAICKSSFCKVYSSDICIFLSNEISKINQNTTSVKY